eukprot:TRINITY_DN6956_c0_g1_i2.p1 TRINITY_DN6956_c0_g1~~TRINITY_DN6956_c0_g1_i2.p1  ORF type:complete len:954 (-),score=297.80 TRINITY_DN6956_c0_g1_i2:273-3134(-)
MASFSGRRPFVLEARISDSPDLRLLDNHIRASNMVWKHLNYPADEIEKLCDPVISTRIIQMAVRKSLPTPANIKSSLLSSLQSSLKNPQHHISDVSPEFLRKIEKIIAPEIHGVLPIAEHLDTILDKNEEYVSETFCSEVRRVITGALSEALWTHQYAMIQFLRRRMNENGSYREVDVVRFLTLVFHAILRTYPPEETSDLTLQFERACPDLQFERLSSSEGTTFEDVMSPEEDADEDDSASGIIHSSGVHSPVHATVQMRVSVEGHTYPISGEHHQRKKTMTSATTTTEKLSSYPPSSIAVHPSVSSGPVGIGSVKRSPLSRRQLSRGDDDSDFEEYEAAARVGARPIIHTSESDEIMEEGDDEDVVDADPPGQDGVEQEMDRRTPGEFTGTMDTASTSASATTLPPAESTSSQSYPDPGPDPESGRKEYVPPPPISTDGFSAGASSMDSPTGQRRTRVRPSSAQMFSPRRVSSPTSTSALQTRIDEIESRIQVLRKTLQRGSVHGTRNTKIEAEVKRLERERRRMKSLMLLPEFIRDESIRSGSSGHGIGHGIGTGRGRGGMIPNGAGIGGGGSGGSWESAGTDAMPMDEFLRKTERGDRIRRFHTRVFGPPTGDGGPASTSGGASTSTTAKSSRGGTSRDASSHGGSSRSGTGTGSASSGGSSSGTSGGVSSSSSPMRDGKSKRAPELEREIERMRELQEDFERKMAMSKRRAATSTNLMKGMRGNSPAKIPPLTSEESERENFMHKLLLHKPWIDPSMVRTRHLSQLRAQYDVDDLLASGREPPRWEDPGVKREMDYIRKTVRPKISHMRESKTDLEILDDARYYNKYTDFIRKRFESRNYYERLGVRATASADDIRRGYRKLALSFHPDSIRRDQRSLFAHEKSFSELVTDIFQMIEESYRVLSEPTARLVYDKRRKFADAVAASSSSGSGSSSSGWIPTTMSSKGGR